MVHIYFFTCSYNSVDNWVCEFARLDYWTENYPAHAV